MFCLPLMKKTRLWEQTKQTRWQEGKTLCEHDNLWETGKTLRKQETALLEQDRDLSEHNVWEQ